MNIREEREAWERAYLSPYAPEAAKHVEETGRTKVRYTA